MKKGYRADACLVLCGVLLWFLADAARLRLEALKALTLCAGTVIPSLFPFMTVTALLVRLGFGQWLAPHTAGLMAPLFRLPGCASSALLLGLVGGYPIGARTAAELDELRRAHQLLCAGTDEPGTGKLTAPETPMAVLAEQFDYILVEADGAARRPLKTHSPH